MNNFFLNKNIAMMQYVMNKYQKSSITFLWELQLIIGLETSDIIKCCITLYFTLYFKEDFQRVERNKKWKLFTVTNKFSLLNSINFSSTMNRILRGSFRNTGFYLTIFNIRGNIEQWYKFFEKFERVLLISKK